MSAALEFHHLNLMPYPHIPAPDEIDSAWVTLSNAHYDPRRGHRLYRDYIEQAVLAERLGFDGTWVTEQHQTAAGTSCDANVLASHIVARTRRIRVGVGTVLPLHANPLRVAESIALLDVMSAGRIVAGFLRGAGMEYHSSRSDPTTSWDRFWEAHDLILRAWTEPGPFLWDGEHHHFPYANPWPRPYQAPHPPVWLPGRGSRDMIGEAARRRHPFLTVFASLESMEAGCRLYREVAAAEGFAPAPAQLGFCVPVYVAEDDVTAHAEARPHVEWLFHNAFRAPSWQRLPPGGTSGRTSGEDPARLSYEELVDRQYVIVGSPDTVAERLAVQAGRLGAGVHVGGGMALGAMPHELVVRSMTLFAERVMPRFRARRAPSALPDPAGAL